MPGLQGSGMFFNIFICPAVMKLWGKEGCKQLCRDKAAVERFSSASVVVGSLSCVSLLVYVFPY